MYDLVTLIAVAVTGWTVGMLHARKIIRRLNRQIGRMEERQSMMDEVLANQRDELEVLYSMDTGMTPQAAAHDEVLMTTEPETDSKH